MNCLEVRSGSNQMILTQIVIEIEVLPRVDPHKISFIDFATNSKSEVQTIRGSNDTSYLCNTDLANEIMRKIPTSLLSNYVTHAQTV